MPYSNRENQFGQKHFSLPPKFDPEEGTTVFEPEKEGYGNWIGGMDTVYDTENEKFYMYHRIRKPLGEGRGYKCRIAESENGIDFEPIWETKADKFRARSVEVGSLIKDPESGKWRLYIGYEDQVTERWRVDLLEADEIEELDPHHHRTVLQPNDYGIDWIKDPRVYIIGGLYHIFANVSVEKRWEEDEDGTRHPTGQDATALATSPDGKRFRNLKYIYEPGGGIQGEKGHFRARINSIIPLPPLYVGLTDMGETYYDNYEEACGIAISHNLRDWHRVTTDEPWVKSPYGNIRYVDALRLDDDIYYYYEYTREDKSHEIRVSKVSL